MRKIDYLIVIGVSVVYLLLLFIKMPWVYTYRFDESLVDKYLRSQDITHGVENRVHISDSDIYIASGYLYALGEEPTKYNFQHPPLVKYLFGFSTKYFGNPYIIQIVFAVVLIFLTYVLGLKLFKSRFIPALAILFLIFDPAFAEVTSNALLDLAQAVFFLLYFILALYYPKKAKLQGFVLGLLFAAKFWTTSLAFVLAIWIFKFLRKEKINYPKLAYSFAIGFVVFLFFYLETYLVFGRHFDIFFFEAKTVKFMLNHNSTGTIGGALMLFLTGKYYSWWDSSVLVSQVWSLVWPLSFFVVLYHNIKTKGRGYESLVYLLPIFYFLFSVTQVPFTRYFVILLPFFYISLAKFLQDNILYYKKTPSESLLFRT